ncbi:MAG: CoA pyrophosphatase [Pseudomonadota bacterium]
MVDIATVEAALALGPMGERSDFDLLTGEASKRLRPGAPRPAAVLCGLVQRPAGVQVILTRRAAHLKQHAGQISFPGGKLDAADPSAEAAALREAEEEVGLDGAHLRLLGRLDDYLTGTAFRVAPFVAEIDPRWRPDPDPQEVAEVFETPLAFLMDPANRVQHFYEKDGLRRDYWAMPWGDYYIWGATAGMLKGLSDRIVALDSG